MDNPTKKPNALQITLTYSPIIHTLLFEEVATAQAALTEIEASIAKGKFRNDPDILRVKHDAGEAVFRASEVIGATLTITEKWQEYGGRVAVGDTPPSPEPQPS